MIQLTHFTHSITEFESKELLPISSEFPYACMYNIMDEFPEKSMPWHWHQQLEINYVESGELIFRTPEHEEILRQGDVFFVNSGIMHFFQAVGDTSCKVYAHLFDMNFLSGHYQSLFEEKYLSPVVRNKSMEYYVVRANSSCTEEMIKYVMKAIELNKEESYGFEFEVRDALCRFWIMFLKETEELRNQIQSGSNVDTMRMKVMIEFVHNHFSEDLTLQKIAESANVSKRECQRCFQVCLATSPMRYLSNYRVYIAAQLLKKKEHTILEVSELCGFRSPSYFSHVFRAEMGCSPRDFMNVIQE